MTEASIAADNSPSPSAPTPAPASAKEEAVDTVRFLALLAIAVLVFRSFFLSPFNIPSESMQPRLLIGDYLLVAKWPYGYSRYSLPFSVPLIPGRIFASTPQRGDENARPPASVYTPATLQALQPRSPAAEQLGCAAWPRGLELRSTAAELLWLPSSCWLHRP